MTPNDHLGGRDESRKKLLAYSGRDYNACCQSCARTEEIRRRCERRREVKFQRKDVDGRVEGGESNVSFTLSISMAEFGTPTVKQGTIPTIEEQYIRDFNVSSLYKPFWVTKGLQRPFAEADRTQVDITGLIS
jgi:hypothetical protein